MLRLGLDEQVSNKIGIILFLLDTGLRASKLCSLKIEDVDQKTGKVQVEHGGGQT